MLREARETLSRGDTLVAYRWDPDSLLAAGLLASIVWGHGYRVGFLAFEDLLPTAGLVGRIVVESRKYDVTVLVGPGWNGPEIDYMARNIHGEVLVVDNHVNRTRPAAFNVVYFNPSPRGDPRGNWITRTFISDVIAGGEYPELVALSVMAVLGEKAHASRRYQDSLARLGVDHRRGSDVYAEASARLWGLTGSQDPGVYAEYPLTIMRSGMNPVNAILGDPMLASYQAVMEVLTGDVRMLSGVDSVVAAVAPGELHLSGLQLVARSIAYRHGKIGLVVKTMGNGEVQFCAWNGSRLENPLSLSLSGLRGAGYRIITAYQGVLDYACAASRGRSVDSVVRDVVSNIK